MSDSEIFLPAGFDFFFFFFFSKKFARHDRFSNHFLLFTAKNKCRIFRAVGHLGPYKHWPNVSMPSGMPFQIRSLPLPKAQRMVWLGITKTCLYNFDPLKPHFYIVKLGFTGVYIIFLIFARNIDCGYSLEPPRRGGSNEYPQSMF